MTNEVVVVMGRDPFGDGELALPASDRGAAGLALLHWANSAQARVATGDSQALAYARAAGLVARAVSDLEHCQARWLLVGRGGCGRDGDRMAARIAFHNRAALVFEVLDVMPDADALHVVRDLGRGARDELVISGPAVLVVSEQVRRIGYVSRHRLRLAAREFQPAPFPALGSSWRVARPRTHLGDSLQHSEGSAADRRNRLVGARDDELQQENRTTIHDSAEQSARHLLRYLRHHGFLEIAHTDHDAPGFAETPTAAHSPARSVRSQDGSRSAPEASDQSGDSPDSLLGALQRAPRPLRGPRPAVRGPFALSVERPS